MRVEQRNVILEAVGLIDNCLDVVWAGDPPWAEADPEVVDYLRQTLGIIREQLKEITAAD